MTTFIVLVCKESAWDISEIQTANNVVCTLVENISNFRIYKIFSDLLSFANFGSTRLYLLLRLLRILNISNVSFSSSLNRLNTLRPYQKFCTHRQCAEPEFRLYLANLCSRDKHCTTALLKNVPSLKVDLFNTWGL